MNVYHHCRLAKALRRTNEAYALFYHPSHQLRSLPQTSIRCIDPNLIPTKRKLANGLPANLDSLEYYPKNENNLIIMLNIGYHPYTYRQIESVRYPRVMGLWEIIPMDHDMIAFTKSWPRKIFWQWFDDWVHNV